MICIWNEDHDSWSMSQSYVFILFETLYNISYILWPVIHGPWYILKCSWNDAYPCTTYRWMFIIFILESSFIFLWFWNNLLISILLHPFWLIISSLNDSYSEYLLPKCKVKLLLFQHKLCDINHVVSRTAKVWIKWRWSLFYLARYWYLNWIWLSSKIRLKFLLVPIRKTKIV